MLGPPVEDDIENGWRQRCAIMAVIQPLDSLAQRGRGLPMTTRLPPPFDKLKPNITGPSDLDSADLPADPVHGVLPDPDALPMITNHYPMPCSKRPISFTPSQPCKPSSGDAPESWSAAIRRSTIIDAEGIQQIVRPDCYVSLGINPISVRRRNGYFIRETGKPPDFVLEIASESTHANDTGFKRELYARLGVAEYWRFDASGGDLYPEALAGERLVNGEYVGIETVRDTDGVVRGHSDWLGLDLCWDNGELRYYNPAAGEYLRNLREAESARLEALSRAEAAEERVRQLEEQLGRRLDNV